MKILILTQKVNKNDSVLGFFHKWIEEFSKHYETVNVVCLEKGEYNLPSNVSVYSLGKEDGESRFKYISRFYKYIWGLRKEYEVVFVHMNQMYVLLGGIIWRILGKRIALWYVHKQKSSSLWLSAKIADVILTSSKESFGYANSKINYLGHGVNLDNFPQQESLKTEIKTLSYFGRITPLKKIEILVDALNILIRKDDKYYLKIIGGSITEKDYEYKRDLEKRIESLGLQNKVEFVPPVPIGEIAPLFKSSYVTVNLSPTGGMDKTVLESLASNRAVFASNLAFKELFGEYAPIFMFTQNDAQNLASKIEEYSKLTHANEITKKVSDKVRKEYDVTTLIKKITNILNG